MFPFDDVIMVKCVHYQHYSMYFPSCISTESKCQLNRTQAYCEMCIGIFTHPHTQRKSVTTVYPKKCEHGFCFAVLCCGYTLTDFPISIRLTSLSLWQSNDCPSASKATLMNMDKYFGSTGVASVSKKTPTIVHKLGEKNTSIYRCYFEMCR